MRQDDDYRDEEEPEQRERRSFLQSGWVRAVLVLVVLAVVLALAVPYVMRWIGGGPPAPVRTAAKPSAPIPAPAPAAPVAVTPPEPVTPPVAAPAPATAAPTAAADKPAASQPAPSVEEKTARAQAVKEKATAEKPRAGETDYWVQLGAFRDERNAERLAAALRDARVPVEVVRARRDAGRNGATTNSGDRHEVFVSGATPQAVNFALRGAGTARAVSDGVVVQPTLDLKDAVALSKRLSGEGLSVKIRRQSEKTVTVGTSASHIVRAGPYPTRARADGARQDLLGKGWGGFIVQGHAK